ncbi:MAG: DNA-processing protein DprA [bacterium]|nr:DNA-processing protein DprA [bacterium]
MIEQINKGQIFKENFPGLLRHINDPPDFLNYRGDIEKIPKDKNHKFLTIVGTRSPSAYGREVCRYLIEGLKGLPITIVSGLAIGIDSLAHSYALENNLQTFAFPGSGLDDEIIYPRSRFNLANEIISSGGLLFSEYKNHEIATPWMFPQRNRLMAGISHLTVVIEAKEKSGSLITAKLASDYARDVGAVPGPIFSELSKGPNLYLSICANPIRSSEDILKLLDLDNFEINTGIIEQKQNIDTSELFSTQTFNLSTDEEKILNLLEIYSNRSEIVYSSGLPINVVSVSISSLILKRLIEEKNGVLHMTKFAKKHF